MHRPPTRGEIFRMKVIGMTTIFRLQVLWGLLALFGTMSWLAIIPAYAFRNKNEENGFKNPTYTLFLIATVGTTVAGVWQSLCPYLIRREQGSIWPRVINHPVTQTATIVISAILAVLNFFSWIILATNEDGAKTSCSEGRLSDRSGYVTQCRGVNVALILNAIVFLLWMPIALVIVCGTIDRGFWWWDARNGLAQGKDQSGEYDLKGARGRPGFNPSLREVSQIQFAEIQTPKPAFVTPIASHFKTSTEIQRSYIEDGYRDDTTSMPQAQRQLYEEQRNQQQQRQQDQKRLRHKASNTSLTPSLASRLSGMFGAGWSSGPMPPPPEPEPSAPSALMQYRAGPSRLREEHSQQAAAVLRDQELDKASVNGDAYTSQWHSRRRDEWS
ncbi:hypothetical protein BGZ98_001201 [Dissophora globulifera]|nr:hypothetical protein BGZ98_001201 [Dissophora globulifera]